LHYGNGLALAALDLLPTLHPLIKTAARSGLREAIQNRLRKVQ